MRGFGSLKRCGIQPVTEEGADCAEYFRSLNGRDSWKMSYVQLWQDRIEGLSLILKQFRGREEGFGLFQQYT